MRVNQLKAGAILSYLSLILTILISLIYTPFMLRKLGQSEYGLFSLINSVIAYLTILDFGFGNAAVRYTAKYRAENNKEKEHAFLGMLFLLYVGIGIIALIIGLLLIFNIESLFQNSLANWEIEKAKILMWIAIVNIAISFPLSLFQSVINAYERFVFIKGLQLVKNVLTPVLMVLVLAMGYKSIGMILVTVILNLLFNLYCIVYCVNNLKVKLQFERFNIPLLKELSIYSFFIFLGIIVDRVYWNTGQFLLGIFSGTVSISVYSIGVQFATYYLSLSTAVSSVFLPRLTAIDVKNSDSNEISELFIKIGRMQLIILGYILSGFILIGEDFVTLWAGSEYSDSYWIALILMVPLTIPLIQNLGISVLQAKNKHAFRSVAYVFIAILNIAISIPLIKAFGIFGCAIGTATAFLVGQGVTMNVYYYKIIRLDIPRFWLEVGKILPAMVLPGIITYVFKQCVVLKGYLGLAIYGGIFSILYLICMWLLGMNTYEKNLAREPYIMLKTRAKKLIMR